MATHRDSARCCTDDGIATGATSKGTWVRIFAPPAEGRVVQGEAGLDVGDRVRVKLIQTTRSGASSTSPAQPTA